MPTRTPIETFEAFDVVVVPFPFTEVDRTKRRPALILSNTAFNRAHAVVVLAMITSATHSTWPSDIPISDVSGAGLRAASVVRMKVFTLDRALVLGKIGSLGQPDRAVAAKTVRAHLF